MKRDKPAISVEIIDEYRYSTGFWLEIAGERGKSAIYVEIVDEYRY